MSAPKPRCVYAMQNSAGDSIESAKRLADADMPFLRRLHTKNSLAARVMHIIKPLSL